MLRLDCCLGCNCDPPDVNADPGVGSFCFASFAALFVLSFIDLTVSAQGKAFLAQFENRGSCLRWVLSQEADRQMLMFAFLLLIQSRTLAHGGVGHYKWTNQKEKRKKVGREEISGPALINPIRLIPLHWPEILPMVIILFWGWRWFFFKS